MSDKWGIAAIVAGAAILGYLWLKGKTSGASSSTSTVSTGGTSTASTTTQTQKPTQWEPATKPVAKWQSSVSGSKTGSNTIFQSASSSSGSMTVWEATQLAGYMVPAGTQITGYGRYPNGIVAFFTPEGIIEERKVGGRVEYSMPGKPGGYWRWIGS